MFGMQPVVLRLLVASVLLLGMVVLMGAWGQRAQAGAPVVVTVNSTANTDDGLCSGAPNAGTGNCTLREAIYAADDGQADVIKFHPPVFSKTTPGVINLESGWGDLPTITREITIDATGTGVIIDGNVNGDGTVCDNAFLLAGTDGHGNPALPCDDGLEVSASHNTFSFTLLGNGNSYFVIQHIAVGPGQADTQNGGGQGIFLCGGDTSIDNTSTSLDCEDFSFGTVHVDGVDIRDVSNEAIKAHGSNLTNLSVTNSSLSGDDSGFIGIADAYSAVHPCTFDDPITALPGHCMTHNKITLDHDIINALNDEAVLMIFNGNLDGNSSIEAIVTNNTFKSDHTAVRVITHNDYAEHGLYNIDINHNSDMHSSDSSAIRVDENVYTFADYVTSTINISDNGAISGGIVATAGQTAGRSDSCDLQASKTFISCDPAIDLFVSLNDGDSHSSSNIMIDRNGDITGSGDSIRTENNVCCGSANHGGTEISDNAKIKGLGGDGIDVRNFAYDACCGVGHTGVGDNGTSQVTIHHNESITGQGSEGVYVDAGAGNYDGDAGENTADVTVSDNGPIRSMGDGDAVEIYNAAFSECCNSSSSGIGDDGTATVHVTGNGPIRSDNSDGVYVDNEAGNVFGGSYEGSGNTATVDISHNGDVRADDVAVNVDTNFAGSWDTGPGDHNTATTMIENNGNLLGLNDQGVVSWTEAGTDSNGPGDGNDASTEISGNGDITGDTGSGDGAGVQSEVYSGGDYNASDHNTASNKVNHNGEIAGTGEDDVYLATTAGDYEQNADADHNSLVNEVIGNGAITSDVDDGIEIDMFAGGGTVDSLDNHTTTTIKENGAITGQGENGIDLNGMFNDGPGNGAWVCCDPADTNTIDISNNTAGIVGQDGDGIRFNGICCSVNIVSIMNNAGTITGTDDGIEYDVNGSGSTPGGGGFVDVDGNGFPDAIEHSINSLHVSGNDISNSAERGIDIQSGAFDGNLVGEPTVPKSIITGNTINGNGDNGIYLNTVQGLNIGPNNTISGNGFASDSRVHAGINIVNVLADDWVVASVYLPAAGNTITQNSIYNNHNAFGDALGIDLNPENTDDGTDGLRVGCATKGNPIDPNDCIPAPSITLIAAGGKIGGTTCSLCTVEVFMADAVPADQPNTVATTQHGEGKTYLASGTADAAGHFSVQLPCGQGAGDLTATATNKVKDTSEFSENRPFLGTPTCATATPTATNTPPPTSTFTPAPPTNTPLPTATSTPAKACGDVNDDGSVNSVDALLVLQFTAAKITSLTNAASGDVNSDGQINSVDAALILQLEAALINASQMHCM